MRTFYFYSLPNSKEPSPYFLRVPAMLRDLSRKGILRFRLWQGRHEAPVPLSDGPEPIFEGKAVPILPAAPWTIRIEIGAQP